MSWVDEYNKMLRTPPAPGTVLTGERVRLNVAIQPGEAPLMFVVAYVPSIVDGPLEWRLRTVDDNQQTGLKILITPQSRESYLNKHGLFDRATIISGVRILRVPYRDSGHYLIGSILEGPA
jgi:hypothetical protein